MEAGRASPQESVQPDQASIERIGSMIAGARIARIVTAAAELGLAELLQHGPQDAGELAAATGTHEPSLCRLLRALAALGLVGMDGGSYTLTPLGAALRADVPERLDLFARYVGNEERWQTWGHLLYSVRSGQPAFDDLFGMTSWEALARDADFARLFNDLMSVGSQTRQEAILAAYDFSRFTTIVDVGGGYGQLLGAILRRHPEARGILYDQPQVVAGAGPLLDELGVSDRCVIAEGSFFERVPAGGDAYMLKFILHDWNDEAASVILRTVQGAMPPGAALVVIDRVLPEDRPPDVGNAVMDLHMLVQLGGKERTESEFRQLFERAGFELLRIVPTSSDLSVVEGQRI